MRFVLWMTLAATLWACTPQTAPVAKAPSQPEKPGAHTEWKQVELAKQKVPLVPEPVGVPAADASCQVYLSHATDCTAAGSTREALARALASTDPVQRDAQLSCLEGTGAELAPGLLRGLRAELAAPGCADVIALPWLELRRPGSERSIEDTVIALATAARLSRLVQKAPELSAPFDKAHFTEFFQGTLKPWIVAQAAAIHDLAAAGPRLTPYAKGVVAVEAGLADMRFVSVVRQVALPKEMSDDPELREAYYAALDEALEPRKARGRDAALVGLRELANEGVLVDPRVERARALLSEVYAGRRINALDKLLLPALKPALSETTDQQLAARLPTFYAGFLLTDVPLDGALLRALVERGLPRPLAARLDPAKLDDASQDLLIRALLERGRRYYRADDFASSARLSASVKVSPERAFYRALASTLQTGPRDASELLLRGAQLPSGTTQVAELDQLAADATNPSAPLAAFDAAYLLGLAPPQNDAKFWEQLAKRFDKASRALHDPRQKKLAHDSSAAAKDTAKALHGSHPSAPPLGQ